MTEEDRKMLREVHDMLSRLIARQELQENEVRRHGKWIADFEHREHAAE